MLNKPRARKILDLPARNKLKTWQFHKTVSWFLHVVKEVSLYKIFFFFSKTTLTCTLKKHTPVLTAQVIINSIASDCICTDFCRMFLPCTAVNCKQNEITKLNSFVLRVRDGN